MWGIYSQVRMANEVIEEAHGACISGLREATQRTKRSNVAKGQIQRASIQVKGEREYVRRQELLYYRLSEAMDAHLEEEAEKEENARFCRLSRLQHHHLRHWQQRKVYQGRRLLSRRMVVSCGQGVA